MAYGYNEDKSKATVYTPDEIEDIISQVMLRAYPVGAIYMSTSSTSPATLFGGTWTRWGTGRVPVGVDANDSNFSTVEKTGGAATVKLTTANLPAHDHTYVKAGANTHVVASASTGTITTASLSSTNTKTSSTGSTTAHNNLQPYITCYMWKRTA